MTDTPTPTDTPTDTPTPTATPTPTPEYFVLMVTPDGEAARMMREYTVAEYWIVLLLFAILLSEWVIYFQERLSGASNK